MRLFRKDPLAVEPVELPEPMRPSTEFVGVGTPFTSPYEFRTANGVPVRLHDMSFLGVDYRVAPATMTLRFVYDDPQWTPPEAAATPVAVFLFEGVRVQKWEDDDDALETDPAHRGQVSALDHYGEANLFDLGTFNTSLSFSAERLTVSMEPRTDS